MFSSSLTNELFKLDLALPATSIAIRIRLSHGEISHETVVFSNANILISDQTIDYLPASRVLLYLQFLRNN